MHKKKNLCTNTSIKDIKKNLIYMRIFKTITPINIKINGIKMYPL
jgi:hypothetical protein